MSNPFDIVADSSIWRSVEAYSVNNSKDPYLRIGIVKRVASTPDTKELRYLVEVRDKSNIYEMSCILLRSSGGVYNYDDTVLRGYKFDDKPDSATTYAAKAGDMVLVGQINGQNREGVILGFLHHRARKSTLDPLKGPQYLSEFNGIETSINELGEYKLTFKAIPKNIAKLDEKPSVELPPAEYDVEIGGSFLNFDKTGSFIINDFTKEDPQSIKIDKPNGSIIITSGKMTVTLTKKDEKIAIKSKLLDISSETKISAATKEFSVDAKDAIKLKGTKVALGGGGTELLTELSKLIDELGKVQAISPMGPCTPLLSTPQWPAILAIQSKIKAITGSL